MKAAPCLPDKGMFEMKTKLCIWIAAILILSCSSVFADTYKLTFNSGTGKFNDGGQYNDLTWTNTIIPKTVVENVYYGPYRMTVTNTTNVPNTSAIMPLVCIDGAVNFNGNAVYFSPGAGITNETALYIANLMLTGQYNSRAELVGLNLALWTLLDPTNQAYHNLTSVTFSSSYSDPSTGKFANTWRDEYLSQSMSFSGTYTVYTPVNQGSSQRFLTVQAPEPSLIMLLGIGVLGVGILAGKNSSQ
jgi:hypothetical protein